MTLLLKFGYFLYDKLTKMLCRGGLLLGVQVRHVKKKVKKNDPSAPASFVGPDVSWLESSGTGRPLARLLPGVSFIYAVVLTVGFCGAGGLTRTQLLLCLSGKMNALGQ